MNRTKHVDDGFDPRRAPGPVPEPTLVVRALQTRTLLREASAKLGTIGMRLFDKRGPNVAEVEFAAGPEDDSAPLQAILDECRMIAANLQAATSSISARLDF